MDSKKRRNRDVKNALSGIHFYTSSIPSEMVKKVENGIMNTEYKDGGKALGRFFFHKESVWNSKRETEAFEKGKGGV